MAEDALRYDVSLPHWKFVSRLNGKNNIYCKFIYTQLLADSLLLWLKWLILCHKDFVNSTEPTFYCYFKFGQVLRVCNVGSSVGPGVTSDMYLNGI